MVDLCLNGTFQITEPRNTSSWEYGGGVGGWDTLMELLTVWTLAVVVMLDHSGISVSYEMCTILGMLPLLAQGFVEVLKKKTSSCLPVEPVFGELVWWLSKSNKQLRKPGDRFWKSSQFLALCCSKCSIYFVTKNWRYSWSIFLSEGVHLWCKTTKCWGLFFLIKLAL